MTYRRSAAQLWAALLIVYLVWGSTYLAIRVVVQGGVPPLLGMGIRFLLAAPLLAAFVALRGGLGRLRITGRELWPRRPLGPCSLPWAMAWSPLLSRQCQAGSRLS